MVEGEAVEVEEVVEEAGPVVGEGATGMVAEVEGECTQTWITSLLVSGSTSRTRCLCPVTRSAW